MQEDTGAGAEREAKAAVTLSMVELVAGGIAHDFNNLLQTILARLDLTLRSTGLSERQIRHLEVALGCAQEAQTLAAQLRLLARGGAPRRTWVDLRELVQAAIDRCLEGSQVTHELVVDPTIGRARLDAAQIGQVFDNLLHNARQAMPEGGHVRVHIDRVQAADDPQAPASSDYLRIRVEDTGPGIPAEALSQVFQPDFTTKPEGSGLGLAICQGVARRHGGQLTCTSEPGKGTTFTLLLPPEGQDSTAPSP